MTSMLRFVFGPCMDNSAVVDPGRPPMSLNPNRTPQKSHFGNNNIINAVRPKQKLDPRQRLLTKKSPKLGTRTDGGIKASVGIDLYHDDVSGTTDRSTKNNCSDKSRNRYYLVDNDRRHGNDLPIRRHRRDDSLTMSASLIETYRGCSTTTTTADPTTDCDFLEEQSVIRRSFKESYVSRKTKNDQKIKVSQTQHTANRQRTKEQQLRRRPDPPDAFHNSDSNKSRFEMGIEQLNKQHNLGDNDDDDNVTTISKASKNPYIVLGISRKTSSSRELHKTYERRLKEVEQLGASDKAIQDVGNAYRRIQAEIKRQEARAFGKEKEVAQEQQQLQKQRVMRRQHPSSSHEETDAILRRESIDARLKDHRELVQELFSNDNSRRSINDSSRDIMRSSRSSVSSRGYVTTLQRSVQNQERALAEMNLVPVEAGALNVNEQNQTIRNSCFYLSLAASYLSGVGAFCENPAETVTAEGNIATLKKDQKQSTMKLALQLKRAIEAAVLLVHPDWAKSGMVGEEVQAFSDFLVYALDSDSILSHLSIAVFDEESGFVDIYRGKHYGKIHPPTKRTSVRQRVRRMNEDQRHPYSRGFMWEYQNCDRKMKCTNTLTLRYTPGHYQPLLPKKVSTQDSRSRERGGDSHGNGLTNRPTLEDILATLEKFQVLHVVTDGRAEFNNN